MPCRPQPPIPLADRHTAATSAFTCYQTLRLLERAFHQRLSACLEDFELDVFDSLLLVQCQFGDDSTTSQRDLAALQSSSAAKISGRLEALRGRGILEARRPSSDRRRQCWRATPRGQDLVRELNRRIASSFGPELLQIVGCVSEKLTRGLADAQPPSTASQQVSSRVA